MEGNAEGSEQVLGFSAVTEKRETERKRGTQRHRDTETQRQKDTETQRDRGTQRAKTDIIYIYIFHFPVSILNFMD